MQKRFFKQKRMYIAIIFVLCFSALTSYSVYSDICANAVEVSKNKLSDHASLFTSYYNDMINEKIGNLEQLAGEIKLSNLQDKGKMEKLVAKYYQWFSTIAVMDRSGQIQYGDKIKKDIYQEDIFGSVVHGKQTMIYDKIVLDEKNRKSMVICTPIIDSGKVVGVLQGILPLSVLEDFLQIGEYSQQNCIFLMTEDGEYVSDSESLRDIVDSNSKNFYTYLSNCNMEGEISSSSDMEMSVSKGKICAIKYERNGKDYIGILSPTKEGKFYISYITSIDYFKEAFRIPKSTMLLLLCTMALWFGLIIAICYLSHSNAKQSVSLARYRLLSKHEKAITFDFQFSPKKMEFFGDMRGVMGYEPHVMLGEEVYDVYDYVHPDDASVRGRIHQFYDSNEEDFSTEIRIKNVSGEYIWYRITAILVRDKNWNVNRNFIGKIVCADQQIAKEKNLVERSENDLLTGVLNKTTMQEKVTKALVSIYGSHHYVFFMIDLDNFKSVNDTLGHIIGDKAIVDTAECLKTVFQSNAYIGRLGGDEFAVCAFFDAFDEESLYHFIKNKAEKICEVNRRTYINGEKEVKITSSVGIAIAPDFAQDFETIYKMADSALYRSKNGGKNCYHIYDAKN